MYVSDIWSGLANIMVDLQEWKNALFEERRHRLEHAEDEEDARPTTGHSDFDAVQKAFKRAQRRVVITTRVDKAANCLYCV